MSLLCFAEKQEGESCGYCYCPPAYTAGDCAEGLICVRDPLIADRAGRCMKKGEQQAGLSCDKLSTA